MRQQLYTKEMIDFLRANFEGADYAELTRLFNSKYSLKKTVSSISNCCLKNGMKKRVALPKSMVDFLRANFKDFTHEELTKRFNNKFNLEKTVYYIEYYCSKYGLKKKDTSSQPVGTEKVWSRNTKSKRGSIFVKVDQAKWKAKHLKWKAKHHLLWEERNGPVPEGHRIIFADGSMDNFSIENLVLVTDSEYFFLLTRRLMNVDEELTKTGINVAKIRERIAECNKKKCAQESACEQQSNRRTDHERQQKT